MIEHVGKGADAGLKFTGMSHTIDIMPVQGERWLGMIHITSPSDAGMMTPEEVRALRDWLDQRLLLHADADRPEHDIDECDKARREGFELDLCRECYMNRYRINHVRLT